MVSIRKGHAWRSIPSLDSKGFGEGAFRLNGHDAAMGIGRKSSDIGIHQRRTMIHDFVRIRLSFQVVAPYIMIMAKSPIPAAIEEASLAIGRLDARVSFSVLQDAWQVRASLQAAVRLAEVDGTPTRQGDVAGLMLGSQLTHGDAYGPAARGLLHWRRSVARAPLSDVSMRVIGKATTRRQSAREAQADWDMEDAIPREARKAVAQGPIPDLDGMVEREGRAALAAMRDADAGMGSLRSVAAGIRDVLRHDPDPGRHVRLHDLLVRIIAEVGRNSAASAKSEAAEAMVRMSTIGEPRLGAVHAVVADRLVDMGVTSSRLSCLTGATKRIGMEGRQDERAVAGFLRALAKEAREGSALLDALEDMVARWSTAPAARFDARSRLPDVLWVFLLLPAADAGWIAASMDMDDRVAQKFVRRLADGGLVVPWSARRTDTGPEERSAEVRLWSAAGFEDAYAMSMRKSAPWSRKRMAIEPWDVLSRVHDADLSVPMAEVFRRFAEGIADIDREFGHLWPDRRKSRAR